MRTGSLTFILFLIELNRYLRGENIIEFPFQEERSI